MGKLFPARESLASEIPGRDGNTAKPFFTVYRRAEIWTMFGFCNTRISKKNYNAGSRIHDNNTGCRQLNAGYINKMPDDGNRIHYYNAVCRQPDIVPIHIAGYQLQMLAAVCQMHNHYA